MMSGLSSDLKYKKSENKPNVTMSDIRSPEMDYFMNEELSDVCFIIDGKRLPALKSFLSVKNRVFRAIFSTNFKEFKDKEVVIEDTTFDAFKTLIHFFHSEQLVLKDMSDLKLIEDVLQLSQRYESIRLFDTIVKHMNTIRMTITNIGLISRIADRSENKELIEKVIEFIEKNLEDFARNYDKLLPHMKDFTHNHLMKGLANNYLQRKGRQIERKVIRTEIWG